MSQIQPGAERVDEGDRSGDAGQKLYWRIAVWVAIGALIAAALVCVVWVLVGSSQNGLIARAFLSILLLAAFAGVALLDASLASRRPQWFVLVSMAGWVLALLAGAIKIWAPIDYYYWDDSAFGRFWALAGIVLVLRLAILHIGLYSRTFVNDRVVFTRIVGLVTIGLVVVLALMLSIPMLFTRVDYGDFYWRVVVSVTILATVGTALVPLIHALNRPRVRAAAPAYAAPQPAAPAPQAWPTYVDGITPLPVLPDGTPDWNAYYTGYPTYPAYAPQQATAPAAPETSAPAPESPAPESPAPEAPLPPAQPPVPEAAPAGTDPAATPDGGVPIPPPPGPATGTGTATGDTPPSA